MKRGAVSTALLGSAAILLALASSNAFGAGTWSYVLVLAGVLVLASPYAAPLQPVVGPLAMVGGVLAIIAVALGLLAATVGGSFRLPEEQAVVLALLFGVGSFGIVVGRVFSRKHYSS